MTYQQFRDVFYEAAECCARSAGAPDERLGLLADFFRQREEALGRRLKSWEDTERASVLDTWVQDAPAQGVEKALAALRAARDQGASTTLKKCLDLQEEIVKLLRQLAESPNAPTVREALEELAASEENAVKELGLADMTGWEA
jgi:hypothetical protein